MTISNQGAKGEGGAASPKGIGICADHGGFGLKEFISGKLREAGFAVTDFGAATLSPDDDFPDYVVPMARAVSSGEIARGVAICGSGVGAAIAANKVPGARACLITEAFSAAQGVEDDDMNIICLGGRVVGDVLAWQLVQLFLAARFTGAVRFQRRLKKVSDLESRPLPSP